MGAIMEVVNAVLLTKSIDAILRGLTILVTADVVLKVIKQPGHWVG